MEERCAKVRVCCSRSCKAFGSARIMKALEQAHGLKAGESSDRIDLDWCGCLGMCGYAPNIEVNEKCIVNECTPETVAEKVLSCSGGSCTHEERFIDIDSALEI